ncbi:hypothetical protein [Mycoplasmopsis bovis]|uniref:hypothetical protein n=1 Tax=Mycoplasmopsis bovis TaxID=28903 RepID=UPI000B2DED14|nr:hypothetical protein [Mycoplasmopsis bovis]
MFKVLCSNYKGLTYEKKINVNRGGLVFASSFPMIAASCENKNPTDESIVNNTTPQTQDNHQKQEKSNGSGNSSTDTAPQTQGNQNQEKPSDSDSSSSDTAPQTQDNHQKQENPSDSGSSSTDATPQTKDKEQEENRSGSGNSSTDTAPQTQDIQKQENKNKEEKDNPKDLLKQLDEIKQEYEKAKKDNEKLIEESNYFNDLKKWFEGYIPKIKHKWNNYSQFRIEVQKKEIDEGWLKLAKEFIEKYKTKIKKDLKERKILIE